MIYGHQPYVRAIQRIVIVARCNIVDYAYGRLVETSIGRATVIVRDIKGRVSEANLTYVHISLWEKMAVVGQDKLADVSYGMTLVGPRWRVMPSQR